MTSSTKYAAHGPVPYACFAAKAVVAGVLTWFFLFAWEFWIGDKEQHITVGKIYVPVAKIGDSQATILTPKQMAFLQIHEDALMSQDLRRKAKVRVQLAHPECEPADVKLLSTISMHQGTPLIEISNISTSPAYPTAFINELVSERIEELIRERKQTPIYQAYYAAVPPVLEGQIEVSNLRKKLDSLPQETTPLSVRDSMRAELEDARKRWELAKEALAQLPPEDESAVLPYDGARSEPYDHAMDPLTLIVHHPWRALASLAVAGLLSIFLVPWSRGAPSSDTGVGTPA